MLYCPICSLPLSLSFHSSRTAWTPRTPSYRSEQHFCPYLFSPHGICSPSLLCMGCCCHGGVVARRYVTVFQSHAAEHEVLAPDVFGRYFSFYFRRFWPLPLCFRYNPVFRQDCLYLQQLLYIQQLSSGSNASLCRLMMVTEVERPSLTQSVSRGVLRIVPDNPVNFLQAVWMPRP